MSRLVFCTLCDATLGVLLQREAGNGPALDFLSYDECWHVTRQQLVDDLEALHSGESSLPVLLKRIGAGVGRLQP